MVPPVMELKWKYEERRAKMEQERKELGPVVLLLKKAIGL
jgi:hypothetical protein